MNNSATTTLTRKTSAFDKRVVEIDFLRGILIILVLLDHFFWIFQAYGPKWCVLSDNNPFFVALKDWGVFYWNHPARDCVRGIALALFVGVSGVSTAFSRNNWKRCGELLLVSLIITGVTQIISAIPSLNLFCVINFNVIHCLTLCVLFYCFVQKKSIRTLVACTAAWFLFSFYIFDALCTIPNVTESHFYVLFQDPNCIDWMPIVPYICYFFIGAIIGRIFYKDRVGYVKHHGWQRPICFVGRHTLILYLLHQVFFQALSLLIFLGLGQVGF